mgnify:CR=1 FL=1
MVSGKVFNRNLILAPAAGLYLSETSDIYCGTTKVFDAATQAFIGDLQAGAGDIGTTEIADLAVTAGKLAADAVTTAKILDDNVTAAKIADSAIDAAAKIVNGVITPIKMAASEALTATADGLTTGLMTGLTSHAVVTSAAATNAITLPASSAGLIGKPFTIWVGANGFELLTPAASNATINTVDSDGTNQVDIPATTLCRVMLVDTGTWILENLTALGAVTTALIPDND